MTEQSRCSQTEKKDVTLPLDGRTITITPGQAGSPAVYLNCFEDNSRDIAAALRAQNAPFCTIIAVSGTDWDKELTPWVAPPLSKRDQPFGGKADEYLSWMQNRLIPEAEATLPESPAYRAIAGYSLAGLFAVYALYRTDLFARAASISGSVWYPDFLEYAVSHEPVRLPECAYFSVGDRECRSRNQALRTVQERTEALERHFQDLGVPTVFELNPGGHFVDEIPRTAKGIQWILEHRNPSD